MTEPMAGFPATPVVHLTAAELRQLREGATAVPYAPAIFRVEGPGAVSCLQGLLTNDVETPGPDAITYHAVLTPKGMIVFDLWALRDSAGFTLLVERQARQAALAIFAKTLPPRLARLTDHTESWTVLRLFGAGLAEHCAAAGLGALPQAGRLAPREYHDDRVTVAAPAESWFQGLVTGPTAAVARAAEALGTAGVANGEERVATAARILAGWPALGAEIGDKTLPQEVRFDEIGGVSYTKGCYLGQETVARVHFRGHPNRHLRGLIWRERGPFVGAAVEADGREVGAIGSLLELPDRRLGLAVLRREVTPGDEVTAGGRAATVAALPFDGRPEAA